LNLDVRRATEVWLVGRREELYVEVPCPMCKRPTVAIYHIQGIAAATDNATTEEFATGMCVDETYFIGPIPVNVALPHERCDWPGAYFPLKPYEPVIPVTLLDYQPGVDPAADPGNTAWLL
jgi:hypothetical protein